jgi:uncharacterized membrane protein
VHLQEVQRVDKTFDIVLFTAFIYTGVSLGFSSLFIVHSLLRRRLLKKEAAAWVAGVLFLCSVAIYVGRDLRWNSWDIITNPGGLLFDISDRLQHPASYPQMLATIVSFFVLLTTIYYVLWASARLLATPRQTRI